MTLLAAEPTMTTMSPTTTIHPEAMIVLICHDGPPAEQQARAMLGRLERRFDDGLEFDVRSWCCGQLDWNDIPARALAHADALAATFCVVAWTGCGQPAPGLRLLVEEWAQSHRATPAVLAVLHAGDAPNRQLVEELRRAADRAGVDLFSSGEGDTAFLALQENPSHPGSAGRIPVDWETGASAFQPPCHLRS